MNSQAHSKTRNLTAVLMAVLMLISVIPFGALTAFADDGWVRVQNTKATYTPVTVYVQSQSLSPEQTYLLSFNDTTVMNYNGTSFVSKNMTRNPSGSTGYYTDTNGSTIYSAGNNYIVDETNSDFTAAEYYYANSRLQNQSNSKFIYRNNNTSSIELNDSGVDISYNSNKQLTTTSVFFMWQITHSMYLSNGTYSFTSSNGTAVTLYQKMTVYKKTVLSEVDGYCHYNGQKSFTVDKGSEFNETSINNTVTVLFKEEPDSTEYTTLDLSDPHVTLEWTAPVDTSTTGAYTAKVYAYGEYLDTITVYVLDEGAFLSNKNADPYTSDLRALFPGVSEDDGKIATDKTVSGGSDQFNVYNDYKDDEFSVALSALGQSYTVVETEETVIEEKVHPDVIFIIDESGSMRVYNVADSTTICRGEATATALNGAIKALYESDPETRIGIVSFSHQYNEVGVYLPLDKYTLPEGQEDYILWGGRNVANIDAANMPALNTASLSGTSYFYPDNKEVTPTNYNSRLRYQITNTGRIRRYIANSTNYTTVTSGLADGRFITDDNGYVFYRSGNNIRIISEEEAFNYEYAVDYRLTSASQTKTLTTSSASSTTAENNLGIPSGLTPTTIATVNGVTYKGYMHAYTNNNQTTYDTAFIYRDDIDGYVAYLNTDYPEYEDENIKITRNANNAQVSYVTYEYNKMNAKPTFKFEEAGYMMSTNFLINSSGEIVKPSSYKFGIGMGTYTQAGLQAAENMFKEYATGDLSHRVPALVLISDGIPTVGCSDTNNPSLGPTKNKTSGIGTQDGDATSSDALTNYGLWTIKTGVKVKQNVTDYYSEHGNTRGMLFYTIGPGVSYTMGKLILSPDEDNMNAAKNDNTAGSGEAGIGVPGELYNKIINEYGSSLDYVDYVDWSYTGNMSSGELNDAFVEIVNKISDVARPITTTVGDSSEVYDAFSENAAMIFTDVIGEGMELTAEPVIVYNKTNFRPTSSETTTANGKTTVIYRYNYKINEPSTNKTYSLSDVGVEVITDASGKQTVKWFIPAEIVPIILHDSKTDSYKYCDPVRLVYKVGLIDDTVMGTFYSNSTKEPATAEYTPMVGNPYYYDIITDDDGKLHSYLKSTNEKETDKTSNPTKTLEYSSSVKVTDNGSVTVFLGNNGVETLLYKVNPDVVVIDYGIPVTIDVLENDFEVQAGSINAIATDIATDTVTEYKSYKESKLAGSIAGNKDELSLKHGKALLNGRKITYTPYDMNMTETDSFFYEYTESNGRHYYTTVTVVPATIMYYEDDFVTFNDTATNKWKIATGSKGQVIQDQDRPGLSSIEETLDANNPYGYDTSGLLCTTYSLGSAHYVNIANGDNAKNGSANPWPTAQFTFTGTAFDLISLTGASTGTILLDVYKGTAATGSSIAHWSVDTYYGYTREQNGYIKHEWTLGNDNRWHVKNSFTDAPEQISESQKLPKNVASADPSVTYITYEKNYEWKSSSFGDDALYQIPVIKSTPLEYGTYTVVIKLVYSKFFDHTSNGNYDFYLDAVRVYAPAEDYDLYNTQYYSQDNEGWPQFIEIRKNLITQADIDESGEGAINGILLTESCTEEASASDFKYYGPNNEVYLSPGQSISFSLSRDNSNMLPDAVQISAKMLSGETGILMVSTDKNISENIAVRSKADMYYVVSNNLSWSGNDSDLITITNIGDDIVSLTNIKITFKEIPLMKFALSNNAYSAKFAMSRATEAYIDSMSECYHQFKYYVTTQPTLNSEGRITGICSDCGLTIEVIIPSLDSSEFIITSEKDATASDNGYVVYEWTNNEYGSITFNEVIPATGVPANNDEPQSTKQSIISFLLSLIQMLKDFFNKIFN